MNGEVLAIYTAAVAQEPLESVPQAALESGKGLVGDRYYRDAGTFSEKLRGSPDSEITLIELEEIERFNAHYGLALGLGEPRRNIVTRNIRLNELVGLRFNVGPVVLEGMRLCEPCAHLARIVSPQVLPGLVHRAGLRACVVSGGTVQRGDAITLG